MGVVDTSQLLSLPPPPAPDIRTYYGLYSRDIWPLCDFKVLPDDVFAVPLANGDIALELSDGHEPSFDVIGAVEGFCFEPPHGSLSLSSLPIFFTPHLIHSQPQAFRFSLAGLKYLAFAIPCSLLCLMRAMAYTTSWLCKLRTFSLAVGSSLSTLSAYAPLWEC